MPTKLCCSLCCTLNDEYKHLQNETGESNEVYEITVKYFDPMLIQDEEYGQFPQKNRVLCLDCWTPIKDFHEFQQHVVKSRSLLQNSEIHQLPLIIKAENEEDGENMDAIFEDDNDLETGDNNDDHNFENFIKRDVDVSDKNSISSDDEVPLISWKKNKATNKNTLILTKIKGAKDEEKSEIGYLKREKRKIGRGRKSKNISIKEYDLQIKKVKISEDKKEKSNSRFNLKKARESDDFIREWKPILECDLCEETSSSFDKLRSHFKEKHKTRFYIKCCERKFYRRYVLVNHIRLHLNPETHKCEICGKVSANKDNLKLHKKLLHEEIKQLECEVCQKLFNLKSSLDRHLLAHASKSTNKNTLILTKIKDAKGEEKSEIGYQKQREKLKVGRGIKSKNISINQNGLEIEEVNINEEDKKEKSNSKFNLEKALESDAFIREWKPILECDLCEETSSSFDKLRSHFKEKHKTRFYIKCCERKFYRRYVLVNHIQLHLNPETHKCEICGKVSANKNNLKLHKKLLHEEIKQHECEVCNKLFNLKSSLDRHLLTHVTGDKDFVCQECGKGYVLEVQLKSHIKTVHNIRSRVCDQCGETVHGIQGLNRHKAFYHHDGKTIYICGICGKIAANEIALLNHKKFVHEKERKYKCTYCDKAFKRPKNLQEHIATHTGQDLYQCPHCPQTFKVNANMHHHRKKVHPVEWEEGRKNRSQVPKVDINHFENQVVL